MSEVYKDVQFLLYVSSTDFEACEQFYKKILNRDPFYAWNDSPEDRGRKFRIGNAVIAVLTQDHPFGDPVTPVNLQIETENADALYEQLSTYPEVVVTQAPFTRPYGWRVFRLKDPAGNHVNFYNVPKD